MVCVAFEVPPDDDATEDDAETEGDDDAEDAAMEAGHAEEGTCTECAAWSPNVEEEDSRIGARDGFHLRFLEFPRGRGSIAERDHHAV